MSNWEIWIYGALTLLWAYAVIRNRLISPAARALCLGVGGALFARLALQGLGVIPP